MHGFVSCKQLRFAQAFALRILEKQPSAYAAFSDDVKRDLFVLYVASANPRFVWSDVPADLRGAVTDRKAIVQRLNPGRNTTS